MSDNRHISLLDTDVNNHTFQIHLIDNICCMLVLLGIIGNLVGLFIFSLSRRTWHISSVYAVLASFSSITNLCCVIRYGSILHSTTRYILRQVVGHLWFACKIYEFSFTCRVISSWITLFWMFERLICVSKRLRNCFIRWNTSKWKLIIPISLMIFILAWVIGPPVYMFEPVMLRSNSTMNMYCELNPTTSNRWKRYFLEVHFGFNHSTIRCLISELIPTGAVLFFNSYIIYHLIRTNRHLHRRKDCKVRTKKQSRTTSWMNGVLILHSLLFLTSLMSHIIGHFIVIEAHETWWVSLAVLINCSLNFYIYCLSGKAFRNEIRRFIQRWKTRFSKKS